MSTTPTGKLTVNHGAALTTDERADFVALQKFAALMFDNFPGDVDGDDMQNHGEKSGLLAKQTMIVPCSTNCSCAESVDEGDESVCYRYTDALKRARAAHAAVVAAGE